GNEKLSSLRAPAPAIFKLLSKPLVIPLFSAPSGAGNTFSNWKTLSQSASVGISQLSPMALQGSIPLCSVTSSKDLAVQVSFWSGLANHPVYTPLKGVPPPM